MTSTSGALCAIPSRRCGVIIAGTTFMTNRGLVNREVLQLIAKGERLVDRPDPHGTAGVAPCAIHRGVIQP
jgi:hypothetical protein